MEKSNSYGVNRLWWLPVISGLIFIGLGVWCLCDPAPFLKIMAYIFAGCIAAVGLFNLFYSIANYNTLPGWGLVLAGGVAEILFSIFMFFIPDATLAYVFVYGVGIYIIFMAFYSFFANFMAAKGSGFWLALILLLLAASVAFSLIFILGPGATAVVGWIWIGISFLTYGAYRLVLACRLRSYLKNNY